jgi:PrgI family protein
VAHTHEVPNHLNVQDTLFLGLSARQVATLMAFASTAYGIWDQLPTLPLVGRGSLAVLVLLAGLAFTLIQPSGRPLDDWAFAVLAYVVTPKKLRWCRPEVDPHEWCLGVASGWVDFEPNLGWGVENSKDVANEDTDVE